MKAQIREYMAKTFFACAWADYQEEFGEGIGMGAEIMDEIPDNYPVSAYDAADHLIKAMERINGATIESIFEICRAEPGNHRREPDEDEFGYCMAMQAMGHGVGWDDNHPGLFHESGWKGKEGYRPQIFETPRIEFSYFDLPDSEYPIPNEETP